MAQSRVTHYSGVKDLMAFIRTRYPNRSDRQVLFLASDGLGITIPGLSIPEEGLWSLF